MKMKNYAQTMNKIFIRAIIALLFFTTSVKTVTAQTTITVSGDITANTSWTKDKFYLLSGFVYVKSGATLTIEPGTIIKGDKNSKGSLIIERGGKIMADGTAAMPIIFTSNEPVGQRDYGDWGGLIICGKAPINVPGGEAVIEGGVGSMYGGGTTPDPNDNSGILRYVRIEFPGIAFQPNSEINGLTMGGVGKGTVIDNIQVSYSGDDSYEWFGGNVNAKHLVAFRGWDDDFDTDFGYQGMVQYGVSLRDPNIADQSGSNGFESDNDATGTTNTPNTQAVFSNISIFGPMVTSTTTINGQYKRAIHLRRNTKESIFNSLVAGYPVGLYIDGSADSANAMNNELQIQNVVISGCLPDSIKTNTGLDINTWFHTSSFGNQIVNDNAQLNINDPFNLSSPNFLPQSTSLLLSGGSFTNAKLQDAFFTNTITFRGAFGTTDWTSGWVNWDPQNTDYNVLSGVKENLVNEINATVYPNPTSSQTTVRFTLAQTENVNIRIYDLAGKIVREVVNEKMNSGSHQIAVNTENLQSGLYIVKVGTSKGIKTLKFAIL